jgi:hypothetical protein
MTGQADWMLWLLAIAACGLIGWYFWHVGVELRAYSRRLIDTIQNWPQIRRSMVEAEARSGRSTPLWLRAVRVLLILAIIGLAVLLVWRKLGNFN